MKTTDRGRKAEEAVAGRLKRQGYEILTHNWRNQLCEIDIIAKKNQTIFFVEVKYRVNEDQGGGLDYITPKKQRQMKFAAELWVAEQNWHGDLRLVAASVSGPDYEDINLVELG